MTSSQTNRPDGGKLASLSLSLSGLQHLRRPTGDFGCESQLILIKQTPAATITLINQGGVIGVRPDTVNDTIITPAENVGQDIY